MLVQVLVEPVMLMQMLHQEKQMPPLQGRPMPLLQESQMLPQVIRTLLLIMSRRKKMMTRKMMERLEVMEGPEMALHLLEQ